MQKAVRNYIFHSRLLYYFLNIVQNIHGKNREVCVVNRTYFYSYFIHWKYLYPIFLSIINAVDIKYEKATRSYNSE